jgi:hypothetical protein
MIDPDTRDYAAEMRAVIDAATADGPYVPGIVAAEIAEKLRATDPGLLDGWLRAQAHQFIREAIGARDRSARSWARHAAPRAEFAAATAAHEAGDPHPLRSYLNLPFPVADGSHRPLATLTRADLLYVEGDYRRRADDNAFYATLMATMAKKVGSGTVADHYTEEQLAAMFGSRRA